MTQIENEVDMDIESLKQRVLDGWAESTTLGNVKVYDGYAAATRYIVYLERELEWCKNKIKEFYGD